jgi:hypothetical protein
LSKGNGKVGTKELKEMVWIRTRQAILSEHMEPIHALLATILVAKPSLSIAHKNPLKLFQEVMTLLQCAMDEWNYVVFMPFCKVVTIILLKQMFVLHL